MGGSYIRCIGVHTNPHHAITVGRTDPTAADSYDSQHTFIRFLSFQYRRHRPCAPQQLHPTR